MLFLILQKSFIRATKRARLHVRREATAGSQAGEFQSRDALEDIVESLKDVLCPMRLGCSRLALRVRRFLGSARSTPHDTYYGTYTART